MVLLATQETDAKAEAQVKAEFILSQVQAVQDAKDMVQRAPKLDFSKAELDLPLVTSILAITIKNTEEDIVVAFPNKILADDLSASSSVDSGDNSDLMAENEKLRKTVQECYQALRSVQEHADLKLKRLELEVTYLRRALADASTINQRLKICVDTKELQQMSAQRTDLDPIQKLRHRDRAIEKHLTNMLMARNQATKENYQLKRMMLQTCTSCRQGISAIVRKNTTAAPSSRTKGLDYGGSIHSGTSTNNNDLGGLGQSSHHSHSAPKFYMPPPIPPSPRTSASPQKSILKNSGHKPMSIVGIAPLPMTESAPLKKSVPASPYPQAAIPASPPFSVQRFSPQVARGGSSTLAERPAPKNLASKTPLVPKSPIRSSKVQTKVWTTTTTITDTTKKQQVRPQQIRSASSSSIADSVPPGDEAVNNESKGKSRKSEGDSVTMDSDDVSSNSGDESPTSALPTKTPEKSTKKKGWWRKSTRGARGNI
jgi:hypothetical protein